MNYYRILTSENTNDKTDLYLMIKDGRITSAHCLYKSEYTKDIVFPIRLIATNITENPRELDFPSVGCPEIVSEEVKNLICEFAHWENVEFLPTYVENFSAKKKYYILHFKELSSGYFDPIKSKYITVGEERKLILSRIRSDKEISYPIFKIPEQPSYLFASETFRKLFKKKKLTGCDFFKYS